MAVRTFRARVKVGGMTTEIRIQADNPQAAKALIEAQYGKNSLIFGPVEV